MTNRRSIALLALICLAGCKLVDQTTFGAQPLPPAPDQLSAALRAGSGIPLVVIRHDGAGTLAAEGLRQAVEMAETRKPGARYEITTVVPATGPIDQQVDAVAQERLTATDLMSTLADLGVAPDRIGLSARTDPTLATREIRIYVH
jgi:hypothetical protein